MGWRGYPRGSRLRLGTCPGERCTEAEDVTRLCSTAQGSRLHPFTALKSSAFLELLGWLAAEGEQVDERSVLVDGSKLDAVVVDQSMSTKWSVDALTAVKSSCLVALSFAPAPETT